MMKHSILVLAVLACVMPCLAGLHTVSSDGLADFSDVQSAINAAVAGDTILVYPGGVYSGFTVDRRVIIMGAGIEPAINKHTKIVGIVTLSSAADATELRSLWIAASVGNPGSYNNRNNAVLRIDGNCYDVFIWRCLIENSNTSGGVIKSAVWVGDTASVRLHQCAVWSSQVSSGNAAAFAVDSLCEISLESCVISRWSYGIYGSPGTTAASPINIRHCIFDGYGYYGITGAFSGFVENCLFIGTTPGLGAPNLNLTHNASVGTGEGSNFVSYIQFNAQNSDYHLTGGSPLINAGNPSSPFDLDGSTADIGVYGGQHPYVKNGAPDYPFVIELEIPTSAPIDGAFPVFSRGRIGPGN